MDELKKRIQKDAAIGEGDIVRVDMFLNHCMDMELLQSAGKALATLGRPSARVHIEHQIHAEKDAKVAEELKKSLSVLHTKE